MTVTGQTTCTSSMSFTSHTHAMAQPKREAREKWSFYDSSFPKTLHKNNDDKVICWIGCSLNGAQSGGQVWLREGSESAKGGSGPKEAFSPSPFQQDLSLLHWEDLIPWIRSPLLIHLAAQFNVTATKWKGSWTGQVLLSLHGKLGEP